jgi:DNA polymerase sigma
MLDAQMEKMVKDTHTMLDSVRKEREWVISSITKKVQEAFNHKFNSFNIGNSSVVGIKRYGSMVSELAIEQSDVDLAVVGLDLNGNKELQIAQMRYLCENLELFMKTYSKIKFIDTATVPVIKLQVDL